METWRLTHDPSYEVSNVGRVRSLIGRGRILRPGISKKLGYPTVVFRPGRTQYVHQLVATAFLGPCPTGQEVRHKDDDRANARADNLEYGTRADNVMDKCLRNKSGKKLNIAVIHEIRALRQIYSQYALARMFGVSRSSIADIDAGRSWAHVA
jgi:hypothetical protein